MLKPSGPGVIAGVRAFLDRLTDPGKRQRLALALTPKDGRASICAASGQKRTPVPGRATGVHDRSCSLRGTTTAMPTLPPLPPVVNGSPFNVRAPVVRPTFADTDVEPLARKRIAWSLRTIARHLGVTRQETCCAVADGRFPRPGMILGTAPLWYRISVPDWIVQSPPTNPPRSERDSYKRETPGALPTLPGV